MKLNVGCGEFRAPGWINLDLAAAGPRQPDVIGSVIELPVRTDALTAAYCGHVLEHLPIEDVGAALSELRRALQPRAELMVVGPDCRRAARLHEQGALDRATLDGARLGAGRWAGDEHLWECDERQLVELLHAAGFADIWPVPQSLVSTSWPVVARVDWQCAVRALA